MNSPDTLLPVLSKIDFLLSSRPAPLSPLLLGIDGKCGAGKTTLAAYLSSLYDTQTVHLDDFFLPLSLRTQERLDEPGGNIHYERVLEEVIEPLRRHAPVITYRRFDCTAMQYIEEPNSLYPWQSQLVLLEGSYAMRPEFRPLYSLTLFLDIDADRQRERLLLRNGTEALPNFLNRWIPMENRYFEYFQVKEACDIVLELEGMPPQDKNTGT